MCGFFAVIRKFAGRRQSDSKRQGEVLGICGRDVTPRCLIIHKWKRLHSNSPSGSSWVFFWNSKVTLTATTATGQKFLNPLGNIWGVFHTDKLKAIYCTRHRGNLATKKKCLRLTFLRLPIKTMSPCCFKTR